MDYSQPLATLFREGTAQAHESVENSKGAGWLTRGELDKEEYARYLMVLYYVYDALERALERHATHPTLQPTYNPTLLARASTLVADVAYLLDTPEADWKSHPIHAQLIARPPPILTKYVDRLQSLADSSDPSPLLAHSYVRYLGDLSGGQVIRRRTAKAYGLDEESGNGVAFYNFNKLGSNQPATVGDMKKIKEWFRDGINQGPGDDAQLKARILDEANTAFIYASEIFDDLKAPTQQSKVVYEASAPPSSEFKVSSVAAVVVAVSIAHFVLVVGGFTGSSGYQKLLHVEDWVKSAWNRILGA